MSQRRRRRHLREKPKAQVDMTSLIDLTFLLLVTFIVTLPALEQGVSIMLPKGKTDEIKLKDNKANTITVQFPTGYFMNGKPTSLAEVEETLKDMVAKDPDVPVLIRGDERCDYGTIMDVVKVVYRCQVRKMSLVTVDK